MCYPKSLCFWCFNIKNYLFFCTRKKNCLKYTTKKLMGEKNIEPVISGGTLTHRLPSASDDRAGLAGSINTISTHLNFTTDYMVDFSKSQAAFLHGINILSSRCHAGTLPAGTYYLVLRCPGCINLIREEYFILPRPPSYSGVPFENLPITVKEGTMFPPCDPIEAASYMLGKETAESILIEAKEYP